jgi:hypothetical protein
MKDKTRILIAEDHALFLCFAGSQKGKGFESLQEPTHNCLRHQKCYPYIINTVWHLRQLMVFEKLMIQLLTSGKDTNQSSYAPNDAGNRCIINFSNAISTVLIRGKLIAPAFVINFPHRSDFEFASLDSSTFSFPAASELPGSKVKIFLYIFTASCFTGRMERMSP